MTDNQKKIVKDSTILVAILIVGIFLGRGTKHVDTTVIDMQLKEKDDTIKILTDQIKVANNDVEHLKDDYNLLQQKDSIITALYQNSQSAYKLLNDKLTSIPTTIKHVSTNSDSIRSEFAKF